MAGKKWGRVETGTHRWQVRYDRLRSEGFVHEEAVRLAAGIIGSKSMKEGRKARRRWIREVLKRFPNITKKTLEAAVDDMYDTYDWADPYSQFYYGESGTE